jgi:hypothetical protein
MSRFEEAKAKLRNVGGSDEESAPALDEMRDTWAGNRDSNRTGGETPMKQHHKDAAGCGRSVGFQFAEDTKVPGEEQGGAATWSDILEREGKRGGKPLFSFDKDGKPIVNMQVQPPSGH